MTVDSDREILIRVSFGDVLLFVAFAREAVAWRRWSRLRDWWKFVRATRRRGTWKPFTVGDFVRRCRMRAHYAHWPRRTPKPAPWRHYAIPGFRHGR